MLVQKVFFFHNNAPSYKLETKSVKYRDVYPNKTQWNPRNSTK